GHVSHDRQPGRAAVGAAPHRTRRSQVHQDSSRRRRAALVQVHSRQRARDHQRHQPPVPPRRRSPLRERVGDSRLGPRGAGRAEGDASSDPPQIFRAGPRRISPSGPAHSARRSCRRRKRELFSPRRRPGARAHGRERAQARPDRRRARLRRRQGRRRRRRSGYPRPEASIRRRHGARDHGDSPADRRDRRRSGHRHARLHARGRRRGDTRGRTARRSPDSERDQSRDVDRPRRGAGGGQEGAAAVFLQSRGAAPRRARADHGDLMAQEKKSKLNREILAVALLVAGLLLTLSLLSFSPRDRSFNTPSGSLSTKNWGGPAGAYVADILLQVFGLTSYLLPIFLFTLSFSLFRDSYERTRPTKLIGGALLVWSASTLLSLVRTVDAWREAGGVVGELTANSLLVALFGRVGAYVIVVPTLLLSAAAVSQKSLLSSVERAPRQLTSLMKWCASVLQRASEKWQAHQEKNENKKKEQREYVPPPIVMKEEIPVEESAPAAAKRPKKKVAAPEKQLDFPELKPDGYQLPPINLLDEPEGGPVKLDKETLEANSLILQNKL